MILNETMKKSVQNPKYFLDSVSPSTNHLSQQPSTSILSRKTENF